MNRKRMKAVLDTIMKYKENYNQKVFHAVLNPNTNDCRTQHCVAGFAEMKARRIRLGSKEDKEGSEEYFCGSGHTYNDTFRTARDYLELTYDQASYLFDANRKWKEVKKVLSTGEFPDWVH